MQAIALSEHAPAASQLVRFALLAYRVPAADSYIAAERGLRRAAPLCLTLPAPLRWKYERPMLRPWLKKSRHSSNPFINVPIPQWTLSALKSNSSAQEHVR